MNLSTMRGILRRRLNEDTADDWSNAELTELLNESLKQIQRRYSIIDRQNNVEVYTMTVSHAAQLLNSGFYDLPAGTISVLSVARLDSSSGAYVPVPKKDFDVLTGTLVGGLGTYPEGLAWGRYGRFIYFAPLLTASSASITIRLTVVAYMTMTADADVPTLPLSLHYAVILQAQIMAWGETHEGIDIVVKELERLMLDAQALADDGPVEIKPSIFKKDYR